MSILADATVPDGSIETLAEVGSITLGKKGRELRVAVKDSGRGNGPAIDLREYLTAEAHAWKSKRVARDLRKGRKLTTSGTNAGYVGPTKVGFWLYLGEALELWNLLGEAIETAAQLPEGEGPA